MSKQTFYLHIGTHKTATTTIQKSIRKNKRELLETDGIKWVEFRDFSRLAELTRTDVTDTNLEEDLQIYLEESLKGHSGSILASHEGLSGSPGKYYANSRVIASILNKALSRYTVEIILMVRRQDEFLQSYFTQLIHSGKSNTTIQEFYQDQDLSNLNWMNFVAPYEEAFGKEHIHVFPFDRVLFEKTTPLDLLNHVVGSKVLGNLRSLSNENIGFSGIGKLISEKLRPKMDDRANWQLRSGLHEVANKGMLNEYNLLDRENKQQLIDFFEPSNKEFFEKYVSPVLNIANFSEPIYEKSEELSEIETYQRLVIYFAEKLASKQVKKNRVKPTITKRLKRKVKSVIENGFKR